MNIKLGKKFILGDTLDRFSPIQESNQNYNRGLKSAGSSDQNGLPSQRSTYDSSSSLPVRDQINKLESILFDFECDLKQSKQDMESVRKTFVNMTKKYNQEFDQLVVEYSNKIKETGDKIQVMKKELVQMTDTQVTEVLQLRCSYDESIQLSKQLGLRNNVVEYEVGFKKVYDF